MHPSQPENVLLTVGTTVLVWLGVWIGFGLIHFALGVGKTIKARYLLCTLRASFLFLATYIICTHQRGSLLQKISCNVRTSHPRCKKRRFSSFQKRILFETHTKWVPSFPRSPPLSRAPPPPPRSYPGTRPRAWASATPCSSPR